MTEVDQGIGKITQKPLERALFGLEMLVYDGLVGKPFDHTASLLRGAARGVALRAVNSAKKGAQIGGEVAWTTARVAPPLAIEATTWAATLALSPVVAAREIRSGAPPEVDETNETAEPPASSLEQLGPVEEQLLGGAPTQLDDAAIEAVKASLAAEGVEITKWQGRLTGHSPPIHSVLNTATPEEIADDLREVTTSKKGSGRMADN